MNIVVTISDNLAETIIRQAEKSEKKVDDLVAEIIAREVSHTSSEKSTLDPASAYDA